MTKLPLYVSHGFAGVEPAHITTDSCPRCGSYVEVFEVIQRQAGKSPWEKSEIPQTECSGCGAVYEFGLVRVDDNE